MNDEMDKIARQFAVMTLATRLPDDYESRLRIIKSAIAAAIQQWDDVQHLKERDRKAVFGGVRPHSV